MPKLKTRKAAIKRFKRTSKGKIMSFKKGFNHLRSKKQAQHRNRLRGKRTLGAISTKIAKRSANID